MMFNTPFSKVEVHRGCGTAHAHMYCCPGYRNNCRVRVRVRVRSSRCRSLSAAYMWYSYVRLRFTSKAGVRFLVSPNEIGANYSLASHTLCSEGVACETGYCSVWGGEKIATQPKGSLTCLSVYFLES